MARQLSTDEDIDDFIIKVREEADDHGPEIDKVIQPLSDEVRSRLDLEVDKVEVYERNGKMARTCWVTIAGKRYVFSYRYDERKIVLKAGSTRGAPKVYFDNTTSLTEIKDVVSKL